MTFGATELMGRVGICPHVLPLKDESIHISAVGASYAHLTGLIKKCSTGPFKATQVKHLTNFVALERYWYHTLLTLDKNEPFFSVLRADIFVHKTFLHETRSI